MAGNKIAALLLKKAPPGESEGAGGDGEDEYDDLSSEEIEEHAHASAKELADACKAGDAAGIWAAFQALHGLDHAKWDKGEEEPEEKEEAEEEEPEAEEK